MAWGINEVSRCGGEACRSIPFTRTGDDTCKTFGNKSWEMEYWFRRFADYFCGPRYISRVKLHSWVDIPPDYFGYFIARGWWYIYNVGQWGWCFQKKVVGGTHNLNIFDNDTEGIDEEDRIMNVVQVDKFKVNSHVLKDEMFNTEPFIDVPNATTKSHRVSNESLMR